MSSMQDKAQYHLSNLDKELSKYPALNNLESQTSVPKVYVVLGLAALYFFLVFFNIAGEFLVNTAGFALPAYWSMEAIFSTGKTDDTQWLTYWVVYSFLTVIESAINASYWFPFYYTFKFVFIMYMALPQTQGAQVVFRSVIQPIFARFFEGGASSANLQAQADKVSGKSLTDDWTIIHSIHCPGHEGCLCWKKWLDEVPPYSDALLDEVEEPALPSASATPPAAVATGQAEAAPAA